MKVQERKAMEKLISKTPTPVWHLFNSLLQTHFSVGAVLAGTARGEVWVDDLYDPQVGYAITTEGYYLTGNISKVGVYPSLKELIPHSAYLVLDPIGWESVLSQVWDNPFARKHLRKNYQLETLKVTDCLNRVPNNFQLGPIDRNLLAKTDLQNFHEISHRINEWESAEDFLQRGFGHCILHERAIVSRCIVDCVEADRCEIGVGTDIRYRLRGLASLVVAATVAEALRRGFRHIGWHCLASNKGSIAVAEKVGFTERKQYVAYSGELPSENAGDLSTEEYSEWARHYEHASEYRLGYALLAAGAWALSGDTERALKNLERLTDISWDGKVEWVEHNWMLSSLHGILPYELILSRLRENKHMNTTV